MLMAHLYPMVTANATLSPIATPATKAYHRRGMTEMGKRLRAALDASGLSQSEVARRIGVSSQTINQWLSGKKAPSRANLMKFVEHTGAKIDELLYGRSLQTSADGASVMTHGRRGRFVDLASIQSVAMRQRVDSDEQIFAHFPCGPNAQAFVLPDDSNAPEYPPGAIWVVDPDEHPRPGDMVVGVEGAEMRPVLGVYRIETSAAGRVEIIAPLNPNWPAARSDLGRLDVIAVMTEDIKPRRAR